MSDWPDNPFNVEPWLLLIWYPMVGLKTGEVARISGAEHEEEFYADPAPARGYTLADVEQMRWSNLIAGMQREIDERWGLEMR